MGSDENTPLEGAEGIAPEPLDEGFVTPPPPPPPPPAAAPPPAAYAPQPTVAAPDPPPAPAAPVGGAQPKDKTAAGILGILLGAFGAHKFYLGYTNEGIMMLGFTLGVWVLGTVLSFVGIGFCLFPLAAVPGIVGLVEGIMYLTKTDAEFHATYVAGKKAWL